MKCYISELLFQIEILTGSSLSCPMTSIGHPEKKAAGFPLNTCGNDDHKLSALLCDV